MISCSTVCFQSIFVALKWKRDPLCLLVKIHQIDLNAFLPYGILVSYFLDGSCKIQLVQIGMHKDNKYIMFAFRLGKN